MSFGIPHIDLEIDNLTADLAKKLNLAKMPAILGDQPPGSTTAAQLYDPTIPGNVWVLEATSNGYSTRKSVRGPTSSTVAMRAGQPVLLKYDIDGKLAVDKVDFTAVQAAGGNPLQNNASDAQANAFVATSSITTLISTPTAPPSTSVAVFGWKPIRSKTLYDFQGALVDLSSFIPMAGNHCVAVIFIKSDLVTVETFASTAKSTSDPITIADIQEAITASTTGSTAIWVWRLHDAQTTIVDADRLVDLRNPWNIASSTTLLDAVILAPGSSTRNLIQPTGNFTNLVLRMFAGQSAAPFAIQDSTPSNLFVFSATGALTVNGGTALVNGDGVSAALQASSYGTSVFPYFIGTAARGTKASPVAVQTNDNLIIFGGRGYPNTAYDAAVIAAKATETFASGTNAGAKLVFQTTATGTETQLTSMQIADNGVVSTFTNDAVTNAVTDGLIVSHDTSGTPAANYGTGIQIQGEDSTTVDTSMVRLRALWTTATHASRKARGVLSAYDTAERDCIEWEASGTAAMIGFFGTAPAAIQTSGANLTNNVTSGGTNDTIADFTSLTVYATDAATIRNDIYQLARKLKQINDGLRTYGIFT